MQFSSIWPIDRALSGVTTPGQRGPGSDGTKGKFSITETSPSDCLVSYIRTFIAGEVLSLYRGEVGVFYSPSRLGKKNKTIDDYAEGLTHERWHRLTVYVKKRRRKRNHKQRELPWCINTRTKRNTLKKQRKAHYNSQLQQWQHKDKLNKNKN